jgi:hypothetical protein
MTAGARGRLRLAAFAVFGLAALVGWLAAGILVFFAFLFTPNAGQGVIVGVLQVLSLVGWLAIVGWLVVDLGRGNPRFILAPFAAWLWVYLVAVFLGTIASFGFGP